MEQLNGAKRWVSTRENAEAAVQWWDGKAKDFATKALPTESSSLAMRLIAEKQMLHNGQLALDVGCGGGRFAFALEKLGAVATGIDFSSEMIRECEAYRAQHGSACDFRVVDWHHLDLDAVHWRGRFDLVLANMTPAVDSEETFAKLSAASKDWCLMVKPTRRRNQILDALTVQLGLNADTVALDNAFIHAFEWLWRHGYQPELAYEEQIWEKQWTLDEAIKEYTLRLSSLYALDDAQKALLATALQQLQHDGMIEEETHTTIAAIYWRV